MYIRSGSDISLTCVAKDMPEPPSHFTWYKGLQILSSGTAIQSLPPGSSGTNTKIVAVKNNVSIETSPNGLENQLLIRNAAPATDAGNYTCVPAGAEPASIVVHVLNGKQQLTVSSHSFNNSRVLYRPMYIILSANISILFIFLRVLFVFVRVVIFEMSIENRTATGSKRRLLGIELLLEIEFLVKMPNVWGLFFLYGSGRKKSLKLSWVHRLHSRDGGKVALRKRMAFAFHSI
jgi:hypothetical protein